MFRKLTLLALLALALMAGSTMAQREPVDRIVAVVGDEVILASELASYIQWQVFQTDRQPKTESELKELQQEIIDQMISDRLFLIAAKNDTSIQIREEEIEQALSERIAGVAGNFPSHDDFLAALADEGLSLRDLRKKFRDEVQNQLLKQRFIQRKLYNVAISRHEVEQFFEEFKDSLPDQPEGAKLAHILLGVAASKAVEDSVAARAEELRQMILNGADFAAISSQHSSLGAGVNGGDLGYVSRNDVVDEFARAAFSLQEGDVSGVVRTQYGYHIIKCEGVLEDQRRLRHILLAAQPGPDDTLRVRGLADSLMAAARAGESFEEMAKVFSIDDESRAQGGELGWFALENLPAEFQPVVAGWTQPNELRGPVSSQYGLHILKLLDHQPMKKFTLDEDYDRIKELARQDKTGHLVDKWVDKLRDETYIKLSMNE